MQIKNSCSGIKLEYGKEICLLMYADDIAFVANDEDNFQDMMNVLNDCCTMWDVTVNLDKSQIMHFRSASKLLTLFSFKYIKWKMYGKSE